MTLGVIALLLAGTFMSAFFSGTETGFYRVPRVRLAIDAVGGDPISRGLLWLTANPSLFVATTLVGNNLANYLVSLAIVMATRQLFSGGGPAAEVLAPIVLAPIVFIYAELFPKNLFFHSPSRLLRAAGPLLFCCTLLFIPVTAVLWAAGKVFELLLGQSPQVIQRRLASTELKRVLEEGHQVGILRPAQRALAQGLFAVARLSVRTAMTPAMRVPTVRQDMSKREVLSLARRQQAAELPVESSGRGHRYIGYVRVAELLLSDRNEVGPIRPLMKVPESDHHITALMRLQAAGEPLAAVIDERGATIGFLTLRQLTEPLLRGGT